MAKQKMNVKLLRKVRDHILEEPMRYQQAVYISRDTEEIAEMQGGVPECGTMACVAGWACILATGRNRHSYSAVRGKAKKFLRLTDEQAIELFSGNFSGSRTFRNLKTPMAKARFAAKRIERLIAADGAH